VAALHFSAVSLVQEPCGSAFETLMKRETARRVTSLDPNVRPTLVKDPDAFRRRIGRMAAMADIIKLSEDDLAWLAPGAAFETIAEKWLGMGTRLAILTRGAAGALALTRNLSLAIPGIAVPVADTVGAGDTFTAGLLARLNRRGLLSKAGIATLTEENLADVTAFAVRAATITVSRPGADPPWRRELGD
jgi:fructokinase